VVFPAFLLAIHRRLALSDNFFRAAADKRRFGRALDADFWDSPLLATRTKAFAFIAIRPPARRIWASRSAISFWTPSRSASSPLRASSNRRFVSFIFRNVTKLSQMPNTRSFRSVHKFVIRILPWAEIVHASGNQKRADHAGRFQP